MRTTIKFEVETEIVFHQASVHVSSDHIDAFRVFADIYQVVEHIPILEPWEPVPICGKTHDDRMSYVVIGSNSAISSGIEDTEIMTLEDFPCEVPVQIEAEIPGVLATGQGILNYLSALNFHIKLDKMRLTAT